MKGVVDDVVAVFAEEAREDSAFFGQKILAVVLAFVLVYALHVAGLVSHSLAEQVRGLMDAVLLTWVLWAFAAAVIRHAGVVEGMGVVWELMQSVIVLTFPLFAVLVNIMNWDLNVLTVYPAHLLAVGAVSFIDASISLLLELQNRKPNSLRVVLAVFAAVQSALLVFMGTYYTSAFWAGDYYRKLYEYLVRI
ncbi:TPA: hypothetical protein EYP13_01815 [Candidatus Micrarchaeota archaeon]|nr:hypothetical protein [Candidatus Micrarchaeota archaeon]